MFSSRGGAGFDRDDARLSPTSTLAWPQSKEGTIYRAAANAPEVIGQSREVRDFTWSSRAWLYWRSIWSSVWSFLMRSSRREISVLSFWMSVALACGRLGVATLKLWEGA